MKQLLISRTGPPAEVTEIHPQERPVPGSGEVLVRIQAAAVNPADLNFIEGVYGKKPELPCVPGMEGFGVIEAVGAGVENLPPGTPVLPLGGPGNWASWRVLPAAQVHPLPEGLDPLQAALLKINPATAWGLLHPGGKQLPEGSWVLQNAASSAAGHCVIQIAKALGLRTLNFVRRPESIPDCAALGADLTFLDSPEGLTEARAALAGLADSQFPELRLALNAVGGDSALRLLDLLSPGGTHLTYGAMGRQALKVPNGLLIFKTLTLSGFWLTRWLEDLGADETTTLYGRLAGLALAGRLNQSIAAAYPVEEYQEALSHAGRAARGGKILLTF